MKAFCSSVNANGVGIVLAGGGDTSPLHVITKLVSTICTERWWGMKNFFKRGLHPFVPACPFAPFRVLVLFCALTPFCAQGSHPLTLGIYFVICHFTFKKVFRIPHTTIPTPRMQGHEKACALMPFRTLLPFLCPRLAPSHPRHLCCHLSFYITCHNRTHFNFLH